MSLKLAVLISDILDRLLEICSDFYKSSYWLMPLVRYVPIFIFLEDSLDTTISKAVLDMDDADGKPRGAPGQASVVFLPIIDLNPKELTCIYSNLHFICDHAQHYDVTLVLTFY